MSDAEFQSNPETMRTRASMLFRLRDWRDDRTWAEFYDLYYGYLYRYARGSGLDHHTAEEVTQDVFRSVAQHIHQFTPQPQPGSFRRWLGNLARWRVLDKLRERARKPDSPRERRRPPEDETRTPTVERLPAPVSDEERLEHDWQEQLLETAMARLAHKVKPQHYQVFRLHHRDQWTLVRISRELGISLASAYIINHRVTRRLRDEVRRLESELN